MRRRSRTRQVLKRTNAGTITRLLKWTGTALLFLAFALAWFTCTHPLVFRAGHGLEIGIGRFAVRTLWASSDKASIAWDVVCLTPSCSIRADHFHLALPVWLAIPAIAVPTAILWYRGRRPPKGHCRKCGYNLTGNVSGVCPECGEATGEVPGDRTACHKLTRSGMRTRLPKPMLIWWIAFIGLLVFLGVSICYGSSEHPVGMALSVAPITAIFAFSISTAIARLSRRPVTVVDAIRIACWTGFGCAEGVGQMSASYYAHYWPQYSTLARTFAGSAMGFCLLVILFVTLCFPIHKPLGEPHCPYCNYDLTGNVSGVCPECGMPTAKDGHAS